MSKKKKTKKIKTRSMPALGMILRTGNHSGSHHNRDHRVEKAGLDRKAKHKRSRGGYNDGETAEY